MGEADEARIEQIANYLTDEKATGEARDAALAELSYLSRTTRVWQSRNAWRAIDGLESPEQQVDLLMAILNGFVLSRHQGELPKRESMRWKSELWKVSADPSKGELRWKALELVAKIESLEAVSNEAWKRVMQAVGRDFPNPKDYNSFVDPFLFELRRSTPQWRREHNRKLYELMKDTSEAIRKKARYVHQILFEGGRLTTAYFEPFEAQHFRPFNAP